MEKAKENKGITLVSLAITIIVIMFLTFSSAFAGYSLVKYTKYMNARTQIEIMQNYVDELYRKGEGYEQGIPILSEEYTINNPNSIYMGALGKRDEYVLTQDEIDAGGEGIKVTDYRFYPAEYITETLGIEGIEYDFLISVKYRDVRLAYGIQYQENEETGTDYYYSAKDFGITRVKFEEPISYAIYDEFSYNEETENLELKGLKFYNQTGNVVSVSRFIIEYTKYEERDAIEWPNKVVITKSSDTYELPITESGNYIPRIKDTSGKIIKSGVKNNT